MPDEDLLPTAGRQAPHVTLAIFTHAISTELPTRIHFSSEGEADAADRLPYANADETARATLIALPENLSNNTWQSDVVLQGHGDSEPKLHAEQHSAITPAHALVCTFASTFARYRSGE